MAGIGFRLRRLTKQGSASAVSGYLGAALIACGPWLLTLLSLLWVQIALPDKGDAFRAVLTYAYALSLMITSTYQNILTRYLADRIHEGDNLCHWPAFQAAASWVLLLGWSLGMATFSQVPFGSGQKALTLLVLILLCLNWLSMTVAAAARAYLPMVLSYAGGAVLTCLLAPITTHLAAFGLGQSTTLLGMLWVLRREFPGRSEWDFGWVGYARRYPGLCLSGMALQACAWTSVLAYWYSPESVQIASLSLCPRHDLAAFVGVLSTVPTVTLFFLHTETSFYRAYRDFFFGILKGRVRLSDLQRSKVQMRNVLGRALEQVGRVQLLVSLTLAYFSQEILLILNLPLDWQISLDLGLAGGLLLVFQQCAVVVLYYYELYAAAAWISCSSLLLQIAVIALTWSQPQLYGIGLVVGCGFGFFACLWRIRSHLRDLEYVTFMNEPMPGTLEGVPSHERFSKMVRQNGQWITP